MTGKFRTQIRTARRQLHDYMAVDALYFAFPYTDGDDVTPITVRVWDQWLALGDLKGTDRHFAEMEDDSPQMIFMRSEVEPQRNMVVSVEPGRAYRIAAIMAPNDISVTARVTRLSASEANGLPVPEAS